MKKIIFLCVICFGCIHDTERYLWVCTSQQKDQLQKFILESIKPANNMSDEEMEDVIDAIYRNGVKAICNCKSVKYSVKDGVIIKVYNLDKDETLMERVW